MIYILLVFICSISSLFSRPNSDDLHSSFYTNIDSMPDIRLKKKPKSLVSDLVSVYVRVYIL